MLSLKNGHSVIFQKNRPIVIFFLRLAGAVDSLFCSNVLDVFGQTCLDVEFVL